MPGCLSWVQPQSPRLSGPRLNRRQTRRGFLYRCAPRVAAADRGGERGEGSVTSASSMRSSRGAARRAPGSTGGAGGRAPWLGLLAVGEEIERLVERGLDFAYRLLGELEVSLRLGDSPASRSCSWRSRSTGTAPA